MVFWKVGTYESDISTVTIVIVTFGSISHSYIDKYDSRFSLILTYGIMFVFTTGLYYNIMLNVLCPLLYQDVCVCVCFNHTLVSLPLYIWTNLLD